MELYIPAIEAILFTMGRSVPVKQIAAALELEEKETWEILNDMIKRYEQEDRGIRIIILEESVQMCTKAQYYDLLIRIASQPKKHTMTDVLLETLSIVAYKQPVTRGEVERIRGVKSDHAVNKLVEYELIEEVGRLDAPGRPVLFATTEEFLRSFGVASVLELPSFNPEQLEQIKSEAEEEIQVPL